MRETKQVSQRDIMFELLNEIENLTKFIKKEKTLLFFIEEKIKEMNIELKKILFLGTTYRSVSEWSQKTYLGIINDYFYFYLEIENDICKKIVIDKNIYLIFDFFYSREFIKNEKNQNLAEIKSLILFQKLQKKLLKLNKEKLKKI